MINKKILFSVTLVTILVLAIVIVIFLKANNDMIVGPGNVSYITAEITHINDLSEFETVVKKSNCDYKVDDMVYIKNTKSCYEIINDEPIEVYDLAEGDMVKIMYSENDGNTIDSVISVERIVKDNTV